MENEGSINPSYFSFKLSCESNMQKVFEPVRRPSNVLLRFIVFIRATRVNDLRTIIVEDAHFNLRYICFLRFITWEIDASSLQWLKRSESEQKMDILCKRDSEFYRQSLLELTNLFLAVKNYTERATTKPTRRTRIEF